VQTRRSTSGYIFLAAGGPISWFSKKQTIVALSTCEAEYIAASTACRDATWIRTLLHEIEHCGDAPDSTPPPPVVMAMDNQSAIALTNMEAPNSRTRHIDIKHRHFKECVQNGVVSVHYVPTTEMAADGFTKALDHTKFQRFVSLIGMTPRSQSG
jgi:hypothetical protein